MELCTDNRFEIIKKAKEDLLESTNINTSEDEMKVLDNFLFRCWQMDWLKMYENNKPTYEELEKALDKACKELEELSKEIGFWKTEDEWKEWCMEE